AGNSRCYLQRRHGDRPRRPRAPLPARRRARLGRPPGMKILVSVDIEGVAGVVHREQTLRGNPEYERGRRWMTAEANAAIAGALTGGATEVLVNDSHGDFRNLLA